MQIFNKLIKVSVVGKCRIGNWNSWQGFCDNRHWQIKIKIFGAGT